MYVFYASKIWFLNIRYLCNLSSDFMKKKSYIIKVESTRKLYFSFWSEKFVWKIICFMKNFLFNTSISKKLTFLYVKTDNYKCSSVFKVFNYVKLKIVHFVEFSFFMRYVTVLTNIKQKYFINSLVKILS